MKQPSLSTVIIFLTWVLMLATSLLGFHGVMAPAPKLSLAMMVTILLMPILFFGLMPLWAHYSPFYHPALARFVDARLGDGALAAFLVRLKPLLLFAATGAIQGGLGLVQAALAHSPSEAYVMSGFFVSGAIGFVLAHKLLYMRKAVGVYPSSEIVPATPIPERKALKEALRLYWPALVVIALFPTMAFVGGEFLHIPFDYLMLPFFIVCFLAGWPYLSGKAPFSFWIVAGLVYLAGGLFAALLTHVIRAVVG